MDNGVKMVGMVKIVKCIADEMAKKNGKWLKSLNYDVNQ